MAAAELPSFPAGYCSFDIDGTITSGADGTVSPRVKSNLKKLREKGYAVILNTGRPAVMANKIPGMVNGEIDFLICVSF